jgi:2-polyprenyl-3-methyl-5-hydroxy-6-metoxy-1,4-benzoquinol methylase
MSAIISLLEEIGFTNTDNLGLFLKGTRDNPKVNVLKCKETGIYILDKIFTNEKYYINNKIYSKRDKVLLKDNKEISTKLLSDNERRSKQHKQFYEGRIVCDFGCGKGDFIREIKNKSKKVIGIELNSINKKKLENEGFEIFNSIDETQDQFDTIFLNHVLEHLTDPVRILEKIKMKLKPGGDLIVEVPHADDFLIKTLDLEAFKKFTFWSEHLILHNKNSLKTFLEYAGFKTYNIEYFQRYPISNHFYWIKKGLPGGHEKFDGTIDKELEKSYNNYLINIKQTDTLIGYFKKI